MENGNVINKVGKPLASNIQCFFSQLFLKVLSGAVPCSPSPFLSWNILYRFMLFAGSVNLFIGQKWYLCDSIA